MASPPRLRVRPSSMPSWFTCANRLSGCAVFPEPPRRAGQCTSPAGPLLPHTDACQAQALFCRDTWKCHNPQAPRTSNNTKPAMIYGIIWRLFIRNCPCILLARQCLARLISAEGARRPRFEGHYCVSFIQRFKADLGKEKLQIQGNGSARQIQLKLHKSARLFLLAAGAGRRIDNPAAHCSLLCFQDFPSWHSRHRNFPA